MSTAPVILVIEDEEAIREGLRDVLIYHGYAVRTAADGKAGLQQALLGGHDLILLDVMLPEIDGFTICREVRNHLPEQAICMLTAKGAEADILRGFECGADDYVAKPFSVKQLLARLDSLMRRSGRKGETAIELGGLFLEVAAQKIGDGQKRIDLTERDVEILTCLARDRGLITSRQKLLQVVWHYTRVDVVETRCVDMHLVKLRRKLEDAFGETGRALIETVRGVGYRLKEAQAA